MYEALLQSADRPFRATPDTRFYFPSECIEQARQTILRTVLRAEGPSLVLGGAGFGKSMLCHKLAEDLASRFDVVKLDSSGLCSRRALLQNILFDLRLPYREMNEGELRMSIMDRMTPSAETAPDGILLIVDEAQTLPPKLLEELRLITNFARQGQPRARLVLVGNMRLEDMFAHPQMDSFNQRLAARCYLQPMNCEQTMEFVRHQFRCVGISPSNIVTHDGLKTIYAASEGIPRLINQVMDHALVLGIAMGQCPISASLIEEAWSDLQQLPAPWHTSNQLGHSSAAESISIEFGELADESEEAFDKKHSVSSPTATVAENLLTPQPMPEVAVEPIVSELHHSEACELESCSFCDTDAEDEEAEYDATHNGPLSFFAAFAQPTNEHPPLFVNDIEASDIEASDIETCEIETCEIETCEIEASDIVRASETVAALNSLCQKHTDAKLKQVESSQLVFDASLAFGFNRHSNAFPRQDVLQNPSNEPVSVLPDTADVLTGCHSELEDDDINTFIVDDESFDATGVWENDPPLTASHHGHPNQPLVQAGSNTAESLFGEDFEEEIRVAIGLKDTHATQEVLPGPQRTLNAVLDKGGLSATSHRAAAAEEQLIAMEIQLHGSDENHLDQVVDEVADQALEAQPVTTLKLPTAFESMYSGDGLTNWSVDVAATEMDREIALHIEIEDLVSQLNFSAFAVEPFSVEQIEIDYQRGTSTKQSLSVGSPSAERDTVYTLQTAKSESKVGDSASIEIHNNLTLDDDRDLLIIEEELPLSSKLASESPASPPTRATSYSQLFAKLRH